MREHIGLFRGKRKDNGEWVEGCLLGRGLIIPKGQVVCKTPDNFLAPANTRAFAVDPDTVGECCGGLRDKNGKLIFEGDVLRKTQSKKSEAVHVAKYNEGYGMWCVASKLRGEESMSLLAPTCDLYEVVGNIHDNKELLKGGEGNG